MGIGPSLRSLANGRAIPHPDNPAAGAVSRPVKKETEGVGGQRGRGFRVVELAAADLIAGRGVQDSFYVCAGNARQKPVRGSVGAGANREKASRTMRPSGVSVSVQHRVLTALPSRSGTSWNSSGNARASRDIAHAPPERSSANPARVWSSIANKWGQLPAPKNTRGPTTSSPMCRDMHQLPVVETELALAEPRQQIGEAILQDLKQCVDGCVAGPFQLDQARGIAGKVNEIDGAAVVVVGIGDPGCDETLVEPPGHVPLLGEVGHRFLEYRLLTPVAIGNARGTPALPELFRAPLDSSGDVARHPLVKSAQETGRCLF